MARDSKSDFAKNDRVYDEVFFIFTKPRHDRTLRLWLGDLAEHVGVNQVGHSVSVDSDLTAPVG